MEPLTLISMHFNGVFFSKVGLFFYCFALFALLKKKSPLYLLLGFYTDTCLSI